MGTDMQKALKSQGTDLPVLVDKLYTVAAHYFPLTAPSTSFSLYLHHCFSMASVLMYRNMTEDSDTQIPRLLAQSVSRVLATHMKTTSLHGCQDLVSSLQRKFTSQVDILEGISCTKVEKI